MEMPALALLAINALALCAVAVQNYRGAGTLDLMKSFNTYLLTYVLAWLLVFFLAFAMPSSAKLDGGLEKLAQGNANLVAYGSGILCCPVTIPILLVFAYVFAKMPGNEGRLSYALFALLVLQQLLYAVESPDPHKAMLWLAILYGAGFFVVLFASAVLLGRPLARAFPDAERRHNEWIQTMLSDPEFGKGDAAALAIKMNLQANAAPARAPGPNETQYIYGPRSRPLFTWKPSEVAAALMCFSVWNLLMYVLPVMI